MLNRTRHIYENFLDPDFAYFLGLVVARGQVTKRGNRREILIDFPIGSLKAEGLTVTYDKGRELEIAVNRIGERLYNLLGQHVQLSISTRRVQLQIDFPTNDLVCRNLDLYLRGRDSYRKFEIPDQVFAADVTIQKEFARGFCDIAATIRKSNVDRAGFHRIYIDVLNDNWRVPVQLCELLQQKLNVPVANVLWGHPNTRESQRRKRGSTWAREHQIRVYAEKFLPIGFYIDYKNDILRELAEANVEKGNPRQRLCNPHKRVKRVPERKPKHPEEGSRKIPSQIRGKHFDSYWQICTALGCKQARKPDPNQVELFELDEDEET